MSNQNLARRSRAEVFFAGVDITQDIKPYLLSLTYQDSESDEADELQIKLQDRDGLWLKSWLAEAIRGAAAARLSISARIIRENWLSDGQDGILPVGPFELDSVDVSGPPAVVTIKAVSEAAASGFRRTKRSKAWENVRLSAIAGEIAAKNGLSLLLECPGDPFYRHLAQSKQTDAEFLAGLCRRAGCSMKVSGGKLVIFDQTVYEAKTPVFTFRRGAGSYIKYGLKSGAAGSEYDSCRVRYTLPSGECVEGIAKKADYNEDAKTNCQLEISQAVYSAGEAKQLAEKLLRLHNRYGKTASFTIPGNPWLAAGSVVALEDWGAFDGKYMICASKHEIGPGGYTTKAELHKCLNGY